MLYLAENVRRMRRERDLTQEELAKKLSVSAKSVSKWERGDGYPDIELLPAIATVFECSVDALLGMEKLRDEETIRNRIREIRGENDISDIIRNPDKYITELRGLHRTYPNNMRIMSDLVECYRLKERYEDAIPLLERILELDPVDSGANYRARLTYCYAYTGRIEEAREMSYKLTGIMHSTDIVWGRAMRGRGKDEFEAWQHAALSLDSAFSEVFSGMVLYDYLTAEQKIELLEQHNKLIDVLYGADYYFKAADVAQNCYKIAAFALEIGDTGKALDNLEKMGTNAILYNKKPKRGQMTSPVLRGVEVNDDPDHKLSRYLLRDDEEDSIYRLLNIGKGHFCPLESEYWDALKAEPRFQAVLDMLKADII